MCNRVLSSEFPTLLENALPMVRHTKDELAAMGFELMGDEPMKFTITLITTNLNNNKQVCKWEIYYDNGSVSSKKF